MKWVTAYGKALVVQEKKQEEFSSHTDGFTGVISSHGVHELLFDPAVGNLPPLFAALMAAQAGLKQTAARSLVWIDPAGTFYPPAVIGSMPGQLDLLRPGPQDLTWATVECLRCKQVGAVVSLLMHRMTRVEARRLQLAAELGGGVGVLLRPNLKSAAANIYAAATRWVVSPAPGERTIQRWHVQQIHGHGRRLSFLLEKNRASGKTNFVYPSASLVDHPLLAKAT